MAFYIYFPTNLTDKVLAVGHIYGLTYRWMIAWICEYHKVSYQRGVAVMPRLRFVSVFATLALPFSISVSPAAIASAGEEVTLDAADGAKVFGTYTMASANNDKIIILFHQALSNRHEYDPTDDIGWPDARLNRSGGLPDIRKGSSQMYDPQ